MAKTTNIFTLLYLIIKYIYKTYFNTKALSRIIIYLYIIKYKIYNTFRRISGVNTQPRDFKVLVSLTSYPPRLKTVFLVIESLLNQSFKPDKIILWLSTSEIKPTDIPNNLLKLKSRGLEIKWVDENIKSYKKLIHAIEAFSDYHIVTCDDDLMYHNWFLQGLYQSYKRHPDCISAYRCRTMRKTNNQQIAPYATWLYTKETQPSHRIFPTSGGGIWYPPHSLDKRITNRIFMTLSPSADDIWFKSMSLLKQTKVVMAGEKVIEFPLIDLNQSQAETLWQINRQANDEQLKTVFKYFGL